MDGTIFAKCVEKDPIDVLKIAPSHLSALLASRDGKNVLPSKYVIVGGETASWDLVTKVAAAGQCRFMNHYGPTETTIGCMTFDLGDRRQGDVQSASVPLGYPVANMVAYVLDSRMRPLPVGVPGELWIGGPGLAKGYSNQPQQTADRFLANPFSPERSARLYRTGDLTRFLPDGSVEFLGRVDEQVKIRGFRVEPAEIEELLRKHAGIRQTVVMARDDADGTKKLVAYFVPATKPGPGIDNLRSFLAEQLPDYMIPAAFVELDAMPLTPNGKIDRSALPLPGQAQTQRAYVAPRTPTEESIVSIWSEVLSVERVGIEDNFFDLGGHSLLATQVISRVRGAFQVQLPLRSIFERPTIAELAVVIEKAQEELNESEDLQSVLAELENLSDEEAQRLLAQEMEKEDEK